MLKRTFFSLLITSLTVVSVNGFAKSIERDLNGDNSSYLGYRNYDEFKLVDSVDKRIPASSKFAKGQGYDQGVQRWKFDELDADYGETP